MLVLVEKKKEKCIAWRALRQIFCQQIGTVFIMLKKEKTKIWKTQTNMQNNLYEKKKEWKQ